MRDSSHALLFGHPWRIGVPYLMLLIWLVFVSCAQAGDISTRLAGSGIVPERHTRGILFRIEHDNLAPSYVLGTIHIDDPRVMALMPHFQPYLHTSRILCTEVKLDFAAAAAEMRTMFFHDGRTLATVLQDKDLYLRLKDLADQRGLPEPMIRNMKPWAAAYLLSMPLPKGQVLDDKLFTDAIRDGKKVCGLESVEEHTRVFDAFTIADQIYMLRETVDHIDDVDRNLKELLSTYLARDLSRMANLVIDAPGMQDARIQQLFFKHLLIDRNEKMVARMQPELGKGSAFFAIGAMHLTGEKGVLRLLETRGYRIEKVY
jgi:hypothetical protein